MNPTPTIVLGGTGYVAGELLRLIAGHPQLKLAGVMSNSQAGTRIADVFPQLQDAFGDQCFGTKVEMLDLLASGEKVALFSAAPHGASAALVAEFIRKADEIDCDLTVVDVSADFRFAEADTYAAVYGQAHGAPELLGQFASAIPEHLAATDRPHIGHPGCFATSLLIGAVPLIKLGIAGPGSVCRRHYRQHRFRAHARRRNTSPGTPLEPVRIQGPRTPTCPRGHGHLRGHRRPAA